MPILPSSWTPQLVIVTFAAQQLHREHATVAVTPRLIWEPVLVELHYVPVSSLVLKPLVLQLMTILEKRVHGLLLFVLNGTWLPHLATLALLVRTGRPKPPAMAAVRGCGFPHRLKRARVPQCLCTLRRPAR